MPPPGGLSDGQTRRTDVFMRLSGLKGLEAVELGRRDAERSEGDRSGSARVFLKDRAYRELKDLILGEVFPPGTFLSERQLTARLDMSKTPIRSALERLESEGFVTVSPQQGIVVRELSVHEIVDLFDVRIALETFVARRLSGRLVPEQMAQVRENLGAQAACVEVGDAVRCTVLDANFHLMLCEFLDNREIVQAMRELRDKLYRVALRVSRQAVGRLQASTEEHRGIAEAVIEGEGERAAARVEAHLEYGKRFLVSR